jgi:ferric-dicitrate binding protein FerR (iron transport regulator)
MPLAVDSLLLSRYSDGEATPEERAAVEAAVAEDPTLAAELEELSTLGALFGSAVPEPCGDALLARLYAIRPVRALGEFRTVEVASPAPSSSLRFLRPLLSAAAILVATGLFLHFRRAEVVLTDVARMTIDARGNVLDIARSAEWRLREGDSIAAGENERLAFRLPDASEVVLAGGGEIRLLDASESRLFRLDRGTVLCTLLDRGQPRCLEAGGYTICAATATFGVRVEGPALRSMGPPAADGRRVVVAVTRGAVEIAEPEEAPVTVAAGERLLVRSGGAWERSAAFEDSMYADLQRLLHRLAREVMPGLFESDTRPILSSQWGRDGDRRVLVVTDPAAAVGTPWLVLRVRAPGETEVRVTRLRPDPRDPSRAEAATVVAGRTGPEGSILVLAPDAFDAPGAERSDRKLPAGRGRLVRLELAASEGGIPVEVMASVWAAHRPAETLEALR